MTADFIREIERKKVRYLIWSNRTFEEYGVPKFGVDFDRALGQYFEGLSASSHHRRRSKERMESCYLGEDRRHAISNANKHGRFDVDYPGSLITMFAECL
jgi:hypothetical protein